MLKAVKRRLYFIAARYFRFWAALKLRRWAPKIIIVTGSAGKTTLLHLIEAQLGGEAHYSHHANSAFGIPFDILGIRAIENSRLEWLSRFLLAPIAAFRRPYTQKIYIVEADADRPNEASFLAKLLHPTVTLWVSALHTHTSQYDQAVQSQQFQNTRQAVAHEYASLCAATTDLVVIDGDNEFMLAQQQRIKAPLDKIQLAQLSDYKLTKTHTTFEFKDRTYHIPALLPRVTFYQLAMMDTLLSYLGKEPDYHFERFKIPPGRSNRLKGIQQTTLLDSTYNNSNVDSLAAVLQLFDDYPAQRKWVVIGDMLEQGEEEAVEHCKIADLLTNRPFERIILIGPRVAEYTAPLLAGKLPESVRLEVFTKPTEVLRYLQENIAGGETILFKGVRYLEGVIEQLLADESDANRLVRRGPVWDKKRAAWGLRP